MNSPEILADLIIESRQEILDSGVRIASDLVGGRDVIDGALEMKRLEYEAIANLSEEEKQAYFGREDAFSELMEYFGSAQKRIDRAIEDAEIDTDEVPDHAKIIEVVERAPLIAVSMVEDVDGFSLGGLEPPLHVVPYLPEPVISPKGVLLDDISERVEGEEVASQRSRRIRVTAIPGAIMRFCQVNSYVREGQIEPSDEKNAGYAFDRVIETPLPQIVTPDLELIEIYEYLGRYAEALKYMEGLATSRLVEEIEPHLELGWRPDR